MQIIFERKMSFLRQLSTECLLVIDGADYRTEEEFLPLTSVGCAVVVTSRNKYSCFEGYGVSALPPETSVQLFFKYSKANCTPENAQTVREILSRVGYHTLTAKLLACYCYNMGMTPEELATEKIVDSLEDYDGVDEKISTLFDLSLLNEQELYAMRVLSLFPNGVAKGKLQRLDKAPLRICPVLVNKGWVQSTDTSYSLHSLIQNSVSAQGINVQDIRPFVQSFADNFRNVGFEDAALAEIVRRIASCVTGNDLLTVKLYHVMANFLSDSAYSNLFRVSQQTYSSQDMNFFNFRNDGCEGFSQFDESFVLNQRAYNLYLSIGEKDVNLASYILSYMGSAMFNQNNFALALDYQNRALKEAEKGGMNPATHTFITILNRIGLTAIETGDFDCAESAFLRYKQIVSQNEVPHANLSMALFNLGNVQFCKGNFAEAEKLYEQSVAANNDNPDTSYGLSELWLKMADISLRQGNRQQAQRYYQKAKNIKRAIVTDDDALQSFCQKFDKIYL